MGSRYPCRVFDLFAVQSNIMLLLTIVLFVVKAFALVDCVSRAPSTFDVFNTWPKRTWLIVLGLALAVHVFFWAPLGLLNLAGTVAALVYLAQVRGSH